MPPNTKASKIARRERPEEQRSQVRQVADDIERVVELGERVVGAVGGASLLARASMEKILGPVIKRALEEQIKDLEQENSYMREVLLTIVDRDGPLMIDRPTENGRLTITVNVRHRTIEVRREGT